MAPINRSMALVIEGIGDDTAYSGGIAWTYGRQTIGTPGTYDVRGGTASREGLAQLPDSVAATVNPFTGDVSGSAFSFTLHGSALAKRLLMARPSRPADSLSAELAVDGTTLNFSGAGYTWSSSDDGTIVWIGDEAILLGSYAAGPQFTGCTRAYYSTIAGLQPNGMNVWRSNPFIRDRRGILYTYDHDAATWTQVWQGFIDPPVASGAVINISSRDLLSVIADGTISRGKKKNAWVWPGGANNLGASYQGRVWFLAQYDESGPKRVNKASATSPHWVAVQPFGELGHVLYANYDSTTGLATLQDVDGTPTGGSKPQLQSEMVPSKDGKGYELLVVDRYRDQSSGGTNAAYADMRSSSRDLTYPFHPVAISMALLTSGYDAFSIAGSIASVLEVEGSVAGTYTPPAATLPAFIDYAWEVDDITGLTDGDTITTWPNTKGGVDMTNTSAPLWYDGGGSPYVRLSGGHLNASIGTKSQPNTVIVVWDNSSSGAAPRALTDSTSGARNSLWIENSSGVKWAAYAGESAPYSVTASPSVATGLQMTAAIFNGSSSVIRVNSTTSSAMTSTGTASLQTGLRFGANIAGAIRPLAGDKFYAIYFVDGSLTSGELDTMQAYCQSKWGTP